MSRFLQLHFLTVYPPSNPNRDDQGRPKSASFGGAPRLRLSSQSIKRAVRQSDVMRKGLDGHIGERTRRLGEHVRMHLLSKGADAKQASEIATKIAQMVSKLDTSKAPEVVNTTLVFFSPKELEKARSIAELALRGEKIPAGKELAQAIMQTADGAVDVAMFGRMLAGEKGISADYIGAYEREAAVQVSHALTTHRALVEDDFYTAVDDLNEKEDLGAGFVGDAGFGSGVYYLYACVDCDLLEENLAGDRALARVAAAALVEALATTSPAGKQNSYAHRPRAGYIRAEFGSQQPRSLAGAFFKAVEGADLMPASVKAMEDMAGLMDKAYGAAFDSHRVMNVADGKGSLADIIAFIEQCLPDA